RRWPDDPATITAPSQVVTQVGAVGSLFEVTASRRRGGWNDHTSLKSFRPGVNTAIPAGFKRERTARQKKSPCGGPQGLSDRLSGPAVIRGCPGTAAGT